VVPAAGYPLMTSPQTESKPLLFKKNFRVSYMCIPSKGRWNVIQRLFVGQLHHGGAQVRHALSRDHTVYLPPMRLSTNEVNHTCLCFSSQSWSSFTDPGWMEGWVGLSTTTMSKQSAQDRYVTEITVVSCSDCHASYSWLVTYQVPRWFTARRRHQHLPKL